MTPRDRRRLAAAAAAGACGIVYLWMLFAWETAWGIDLKHRDSPPWLVGTFWEMQWAVACAALVLLAALCAAAEGLELWKRPPRYKGPRMFRVGDNASRVGLLALLLVACRVISLHAVSHHVGGRRGRAPSARVWFCQNDDKIRCLKGHAHQFGWDAMVPMALLGVPAQQFSPPFRALGLSHEAAVAFHRVLGRATLVLVTLHFATYALAWGIAGGWSRVWDETFQVCARAGRVHDGLAALSGRRRDEGGGRRRAARAAGPRRRGGRRRRRRRARKRARIPGRGLRRRLARGRAVRPPREILV